MIWWTGQCTPVWYNISFKWNFRRYTSAIENIFELSKYNEPKARLIFQKWKQRVNRNLDMIMNWNANPALNELKFWSNRSQTVVFIKKSKWSDKSYLSWLQSISNASDIPIGTIIRNSKTTANWNKLFKFQTNKLFNYMWFKLLLLIEIKSSSVNSTQTEI